MDTKPFRAFVTVSECGHFGQAAELLGMSASAVSRSVQSLEAWIGVQLIVRTSRRVHLTSAGIELLPRAYLILQSLEDFRRAGELAGSGQLGRISIGYMDIAMTDLLPAILSRFRKNCPGAKVELVYGWKERHREYLLNGRIDVGFLVGPVLDRELVGRSIKKYGLVAVLSEDHRLALQPAIDLAELREDHFILGTKQEWHGLWNTVEGLASSCGLALPTVQEAPSRDAIFGLVAAGLGVTVFPDTAKALLRPGIVAVPLRNPAASLDVFAAWRRNPAPMVKRFIEELGASD